MKLEIKTKRVQIILNTETNSLFNLPISLFILHFTANRGWILLN